VGWIKEADFGSENFTDSILSPLPSSLTCVQFCSSVVQILGSVLLSDNGSAAQYIQTHQLIEVLLLPLKNSLSQMDDANYDVGVVSLIANCIHLSSRPGMLHTNLVSILLTTTTTTTTNTTIH
jgi:hypothetical protein